jgi:hypothetical protein
MARLIDDIRAFGLAMPHVVSPAKHKAWSETGERILALLEDRSIPVIVADNVAAYYFSGTSQEHWDLLRDFPNLAPPFEMFWVEHRMPHRINSSEGDTDLSGLNIRVGILVFGVERHQVRGDGIPENAHWLLACEVFVDYGLQRGDVTQGPHGTIQLAINSDGQLIDRPWMMHYADDNATAVMQSFMGWIHPALLTISFLHCKNVTVNENVVPKPLAKKYEARTGVKPSGYKTLVIEPLKTILRNQGRSDTVGLAKAMHICRGHFKDYRQGKGLFGKYHQLVWHPSVVRGTGAADEKPERTIEVKV